MIYYFLLFLFFLFLSIFITFIVRAENRFHVLIAISMIFCAYLSRELLFVLLIFSLFDYITLKGIYSRNMNMISSLFLTVLSFFYFSSFPFFFDLGVIKFNLLTFSLTIIFFNRLNSYLHKEDLSSLLNILFFNIFFPRLFTPVISNYSEETSHFGGEIHFSLAELKKGGKKIILSFFVILCILIPGGRFLDSIQPPLFLYFSKGLLFISFIYSLYDLGAGCLEVFNYRVYRNFDSPLAPSSFIDFWKRWCVTIFNFSKLIQINIFSKPSNYLTVFISILIHLVYFQNFLRETEFLITMSILLILSSILSKSSVFNRISFRSNLTGNIVKGITIVLIISSFGFSLKSPNNFLGTEGIDIGSIIIFFLSCLILFLFHYQQKRNKSGAALLKYSRTITFGTFFIYIMMFGDFL